MRRDRENVGVVVATAASPDLELCAESGTLIARANREAAPRNRQGANRGSAFRHFETLPGGGPIRNGVKPSPRRRLLSADPLGNFGPCIALQKQSVYMCELRAWM